MSASLSFFDHFAELEDPRANNALHPLRNIVFIAVCAVHATTGAPSPGAW